MKIIHCADIHLGSKLDSKFTKEISDERKREVLSTFNRMIDYAEKENVQVIILSGDVFDSDRPAKKDKDFFYSAIKGTPNIDFLYLKGNHDSQISYEVQDIENLKMFSNEWKTYSYENVDISGIELVDENVFSLYSTLNLKKDRTNIVMMHGNVSKTPGKDSIAVSKLKDKYIDYLALGHIHSYSIQALDDRGKYGYSGCLEGRGFDEMGDKGFILLTVEDKIQSEFVPFSTRKIKEFNIDITDAKSLFDAQKMVKVAINADKNDIVRIELTGDVEFDNFGLEEDFKSFLSNSHYFVDVKNSTKKKYNLSDYEGDISLQGEFIRIVLNNIEYSESDKARIIDFGLKALSGEKVKS